MGNSTAQKPPVWSPVFVLVIFVSLAVTCVVDALQAALPIYMEQIGQSSTLGGLSITVFSLAAILPALVSGVLADNYGCKRIMTIGGVVFLLGAIGALCSTSIVSLLVFRAVQGVGFAMLNVTTAAGASNVLPLSRLGEGLGYFGVGQSVAMALGPMLGLWLVELGAVPMWCGISVISLLILICSFFCHCDRPSSKEPGAHTPINWKQLIEKRAILPALMILIFSTGICAIIVFSGLYAKQQGYGNAGPFFIVAALAMLAVRFCSGLFMDRYSTLTILLPALGIGIATFLWLAFVPGRIPFYFAGALFGCSFGVAMPLLSAVAVKRTPKERWGAANATYYLCVNLGFGTGALCGGLAIDMVGFSNALLLGILTAIIPAILGIIFLRETKHTEVPASAPLALAKVC